MQAASATVSCSLPEGDLRGPEAGEPRGKTTRDDKKETRKEHETMIVVVLTMMYSLYFVKMFYYCFVMSKVVQRRVFWLWKKCVREEEW